MNKHYLFDFFFSVCMSAGEKHRIILFLESKSNLNGIVSNLWILIIYFFFVKQLSFWFTLLISILDLSHTHTHNSNRLIIFFSSFLRLFFFYRWKMVREKKRYWHYDYEIIAKQNKKKNRIESNSLNIYNQNSV